MDRTIKLLPLSAQQKIFQTSSNRRTIIQAFHIGFQSMFSM